MRNTTRYQTLAGELVLTFQGLEGKTYLTNCYQQPPLKVSRALYSNECGHASVYLIDTSGGIACGDQNQIMITATNHASAEMIQQSATKIYPARLSETMSRQAITITVAEGSKFYWLPETTIPFAGSRFKQTIELQVDASSTCYFADILSPGREKHDETFQYKTIDSSLRIFYDNHLLAYDRLHFQPGDKKQIGLLDNYYFGSAWYISDSIPEELAIIQNRMTKHPAIRCAVTELDPVGLHARWLSDDLCLLKEQMAQFQAFVCSQDD